MSGFKSSLSPVAAGLLFASLAVAGGCNALDFVPLATATKTLSEDFQTLSSPKIVIDTFNGTIDVSRGGDDEVIVDVTKRAGGFDQPTAEAALDTVQVTMIQKENTIEITARQLDHRPGSFGASVVIAVPAAAQLDLHTSNGAIVCEAVEGRVDARSCNGKLEIVAAKGPLSLNTSNGSIEIEAADAVVDARTSNGRIEFRGSLAEGQHKLKTSNGRVELVLPDDARFHFSGVTSNSRIRSDFNVATSGRSRRSVLEGTVGPDPDPGCKIIATTSNGSITLRKATTQVLD